MQFQRKSDGLADGEHAEEGVFLLDKGAVRGGGAPVKVVQRIAEGVALTQSSSSA